MFVSEGLDERVGHCAEGVDVVERGSFEVAGSGETGDVSSACGFHYRFFAVGSTRPEVDDGASCSGLDDAGCFGRE